jgi:hypothetical protein
MVAYPQSQPVFVSPVAGDFLSGPAHAALHTQEDLEIEAIAAELGLNPSGIVFPTVVTRLEAIEASITSLEFVDLTDTPSDYSGAALQVVRVNAGGTGLEFFPGGATTFVALTDTPADYTSQSLNLYRVNVGETGVESVTPDYALISAGDAATDITGAELETLTDGSNADALHVHSAGSSASEVTFDITQATHGFSVGDWIRHNGTIYVTAQADVDANSDALGVVSAVAGVNDFTIFLHGYITGLSGLTVGVAHFISDTVAGAITDVPPADLGEIVKPVLVADSATTGYVNVLRGNEVTAAIPGITVDDEGTPITTDVSSFDFVGAGVTATNVGDDVTITIPGGGVSTFVGLSDTPANFTSQSLDFYRVNAGETAVEAVTLTYAIVSAGDGATDVTAAELETLTDGSNADALHVHAGGATLDHDVNQTTHGFSVNDWIYHNGTIYALADASASATAESIGVVSAVAGANDFTVQFGGRITGLSGLTVGEAHFLSETPGTITATAPSTVTAVVKPVLIADTTTTGFIFNMRGSTVTDSTSFTDSFVDGDLSTGVLTITHNLGRQYVQVQIFDDSDNLVQPDDITLTDSNTTTVDLLSFGAISGTWHFVIMDSGATVNLAALSFRQSFVDGDLTVGVLTVNHALGEKFVDVSVYDDSDKKIIPDDITLTDANNLDIDILGFGTITGTWNVVVLR